MRITPLFSGSTGNCTLVSTGSTCILVDVGKAVKHIEEAVQRAGEDMRSISAIIITHEHRDHTSGLKGILKRYDIPVYTTAGTWEVIRERTPGLRSPRFREVRPGEVFRIGAALVRAFQIPHDAACPVGYRIEAEGRSFAIATDIGQAQPGWLEALRGCDAVMLECNYNEDLLSKSDKPEFCKERVRSDHGHLSNEECADVVVDLVRGGVGHICLGHMSATSNRPELARDVVTKRLKAAGLVDGKDYGLTIAERDNVSRSIWL